MESECPECGSPHTRCELKLINDGKIQRICECKICHHRWDEIVEISSQINKVVIDEATEIPDDVFTTIYDKLPEKYKTSLRGGEWIKRIPLYVLEKEYRIKTEEGTIGQNIDSLIEDFKVVGEGIIDLAVREGCIALRTNDTKMRWENRAKLFIPDIELIQVWKREL